MKLASLRVRNHSELAVLTEEGMVPLHSLKLNGAENVKINLTKLMKNRFLVDHIDEVICEMAGKLPTLDPGDYKFESAVGKPEKIVCLGHNYRSHVKELNEELPEYPIIFSKFNNTLAAHDEDIPLPEESRMVDYEGELGIIIGKTAYNVPEEEALDYVFGYFAANDLSARDLQFKTQQWLIGKTCEKFFPNGPYIVTADEVGDPQNLSLKTYVNGELRQSANTSEMIFNCRQIISYVSRYMVLRPGDIISTGTPQGVIVGMPEEKREWLKDGDVVEVEIEKLGRLKNMMKARPLERQE